MGSWSLGARSWGSACSVGGCGWRSGTVSAGERSRIEEACVALRQEIDAVRVPDPRSEKVLRLQEDLALLLSRLGRTDESRPMWRHLLRERLHFAPTRATKGRNAQEEKG